MHKKVEQKHILSAGIPGSGKTTYCRWLEQEKGFLHLDFDELLDGRGTEQKLSLIECLHHSAKEFIRAISDQGQPIAIDWGFPLSMLTLIRMFKANQIAIWWFDGDRNAARESFVRRGTVPLKDFAAQIESIEKEWAQIDHIVEGNVINTVTAGPAHTSPEYIYSRMFQGEVDRTLLRRNQN